MRNNNDDSQKHGSRQHVEKREEEGGRRSRNGKEDRQSRGPGHHHITVRWCSLLTGEVRDLLAQSPKCLVRSRWPRTALANSRAREGGAVAGLWT